MPVIHVDTHACGYTAAPETFSPSRPAVVFAHGSGGDKDDWSGQAALGGESLTVIAVDLPGHGESSGPPLGDIGAYGEWLAKFVEALGLEHVILAGCSLGSAVAMWPAVHGRPQWLKGLVLVGSGARLKVHPDFLEGLRTDGQKAIENLAEYALSPNAASETKQALNNKFRASGADLIRRDLSACNEFDAMDLVAQIAVPTLIITGERDRLTPVKYARFLHERIPGSVMKIIPGAGHLCMIEDPVAFNRELSEFLARIV